MALIERRFPLLIKRCYAWLFALTFLIALSAIVFAREHVPFPNNYSVGTIVVDNKTRTLNLIINKYEAIQYPVGVGRPGFLMTGDFKITRKAEWPSWRPPEAMLRRRPDLPRFMPGGIDNPLGARALYLGNTLYRIHGTNEPESIGGAVSSGCIRMLNSDIEELYEYVKVGTRVIVR